MTLTSTVEGEVPADAVERAIALSREKYCSVWHSMRQDIDFDRRAHDVAPIGARYIDWARGIAVLLMIEAHAADAWTRAADKNSVHLSRRDDPRRLRRAAVPLARGPGGRARGDADGGADRQPLPRGRGHRAARPR